MWAGKEPRLLECSQTSPARPSGGRSLKMKMYEEGVSNGDGSTLKLGPQKFLINP